jgi:hypothetical protein
MKKINDHNIIAFSDRCAYLHNGERKNAAMKKREKVCGRSRSPLLISFRPKQPPQR